MPLRLGNSLVVVVGVAGVVAVLTSALALSSGFRQTLDRDARADRAVVLTRNAESEAASSFTRADVDAIRETPGIRSSETGKPIVSAEVILVAPVTRRSDGSDVHVTLRGVGDSIALLRPEMKIVEGRMFRSGVNELLVGRSAQVQFSGLQVGDAVRLQEGDWTVVGVFENAGSARESELVADAESVLSAYKAASFNSVHVLLESPASIADLQQGLRRIPGLIAEVRSEPDYMASVSRSVNRMLRLVAYFIGSIMAIGAFFGALNTMYSATAARSGEIATLRAIGFGSATILASFLIEALLLALGGAVIGIGAAYLAFDGKTVSTLGGAIWDSQLVYSLTITPSLVVIALALAAMIGLMGGLFPAIRAVRLPVAEALRAG
jgi:putative ABC transport system permease protein